jgi:WW domain-containing oxidoreductase
MVDMSNPIPFGPRSTADDVLAGLDLSGRTILITGCNAGIGFETFRALAHHGADVIGLARNLEAARAACQRASGSSCPVACDLADLDSIIEATRTVRRLGRPVDAIVASAGIMGSKELQVRDGVELQFLVNHVGHFALINELIDLVPDHTGRIVIVSSSSSIQQAPKQGILFDNLDGHRFYRPFAFYGQSKLACALFAKELSRRLAPRGILVNSLHPGAVGGTGLNRGLGFPFTAMLAIARYFMKSVPQGAATQTLLAGSPLVDGISGEYWVDCQIGKGSPFLNDRAMAERLWTVTEGIVAAHAMGAMEQPKESYNSAKPINARARQASLPERDTYPAKNRLGLR